ncbi:hypothetical protein [uncultured Aquimarina sp.]|uniref:hypothetical protein n=1 Tax=uncultured Aquimarina sp. TaxID=575652 RepID=UPI002614491C|nr:hypothetical protein [uncultured Aquimarina sp.]
MKIIITILLLSAIIISSIEISKKDNEIVAVELIKTQKDWIIRLPGSDNILGEFNYKLTTNKNPLGVDMDDKNSLDDIVLINEDIFLPKNSNIIFYSRTIDVEVLHRVRIEKWDLTFNIVPGMVTYSEYDLDKGITNKNEEEIIIECIEKRQEIHANIKSKWKLLPKKNSISG